MSIEHSSTSSSTDRLTVAAWNILLDRRYGDKVKPQAERIESHAKTLLELGLNLDAVALMEVEATGDGHHGERIAQLTGYGDGLWQQHSRKGEHIGMFGSAIDEVRFVDLGHKKKAAIAKLGTSGLTAAGVHLKFQFRGPERAEQMTALLDYTEEETVDIIMGDFNSLQWQQPRKMMERAGYVSVFEALGRRRPATVPTRAYRPILNPTRRIGSLLGYNVDDIYVKNIEVVDAGVFIGDSDHAGVWATLQP